MTVSTTQAEPAKRPRRRLRAAVLAALLLLIGFVLLSYSLFTYTQETGAAAPQAYPTTTLSPTAQTQTVAATPLPTPGDTSSPEPADPPVVVITTFVAVPTYVNVPATSSDDSTLLSLVTTVSGLLASVAGIVSAVVSARGSRPR